MSDEREVTENEIVELVSWLEKAANEWSAKQTYNDMLQGVRKTCRLVHYEFANIDNGILEVCFFLPKQEVQKAFKLGNDLSELDQWFDTINSNEIKVELAEHKKLGTCFVLRRFHYIPREHRDKWLSSLVLPEEDLLLLRRLLNRPPAQLPNG